MQLEYKPDWEETKARYRAFWNREYFGRCALAVSAPRDNAPADPPPPRPPTPHARWTDLDYAAACNTWRMRRTYYGGESFPVWTVGYPGHASIPTFLGSPIGLDYDTGWHTPIITGEGLAEVQRLPVDRAGEWWQFSLRMLERAVHESQGRCIPSIGAFGGGGDTLAALRGTDRLLYDVMDRPDEVVDAEHHLMDIWFDVYDRFYRIVRDASEGSTCWFGLWSPGKTYAAQNDFSYMISPCMFRDLFLPVIKRQTEFLDHTVYHVDGIEAFAHVPVLCTLPRLQTLQIQPGVGKPSPLHFMDTLRRVQRAGKNLHLTLTPEELEPALRALSARGLFIATWTRTEAEARELLAQAERWSVADR